MKLSNLSIVGLLVATLFVTAGCGNEIGDSCSLDIDCSQRGDRFCDNSSPGGYCTVIGCDETSCPESSVCVRFFTVTSSNLTCTADNDCTPDELCHIDGSCVPRSAEIRYCMKTCDGHGDCRDKYECRDRELMEMHGGEPVRAAGTERPASPTEFCAPKL